MCIYMCVCVSSDEWCNIGPVVDGIISKSGKDIVLPKWIIDCVQEQDLVPLAPKYMLHTTEETKASFREEMDRWGDLYIQDATEQSLRDVRFISHDTMSDGCNGIHILNINVYPPTNNHISTILYFHVWWDWDGLGHVTNV